MSKNLTIEQITSDNCWLKTKNTKVVLHSKFLIFKIQYTKPTDEHGDHFLRLKLNRL